MVKIAVPSETEPNEGRVAATPETVKRFKALGIDVAIQSGAGMASRLSDEAFAEEGADIIGDLTTLVKDADIILRVRRPADKDFRAYPSGAMVVAQMDPYGHEASVEKMAKAGLTGVAMEFMPRITRAQVMDVLSSQANLAGYQAVIDAAEVFDRAMPMMMTAAGTVPAAKVFVMGAGVAGLQAIATARRLGAVVTATDVRAAAGEQVESLGAKFIMTDALKDASGDGGYARELTDDEKASQSELVAGHIAKQDIVITTALIPGRPAPQLVTKAMVESMKPGSVLVDLAVERGGNVEGAKAGEIAEVGGAKIVGYLNVPGRIAATASLLYAKNLYSFIDTLMDKETNTLKVNWDDELVAATVLTRDGAVVHPAFAPKTDTPEGEAS